MSDTPLTREEFEDCVSSTSNYKRQLVLDYDAALRAENERLAEQLRLCNIDQCNAEAQVTALKHDLKDMHDYHDHAMEALYDELGIDKTDGEIRFKWVSIAVANLKQQLAAMAQERDEAMEALGYPMPYDPSARCGKIVCGLCGPREQQLAAMTEERDALKQSRLCAETYLPIIAEHLHFKTTYASLTSGWCENLCIAVKDLTSEADGLRAQCERLMARLSASQAEPEGDA